MFSQPRSHQRRGELSDARQKLSSVTVVSPFLDKWHGTERYVTEWLNRAGEIFNVRVYCQRAEDIDLSRITLRRIPKLPGPHLVNYVWWLAANHFWRAWDHRFRGVQTDIVYSPGINCFDAELISVHILFTELLRKNSEALRLRGSKNPIAEWPRQIHRHIYYWLIAALEQRIYRRPGLSLFAVSAKISHALQQLSSVQNLPPVVYFGLEQGIFDTQVRRLRDAARAEFHLAPEDFTLLLIGNDWLNKGLPSILEALQRMRELPIHLLVVGQDDPAPFRKIARTKSLERQLHFLPPRKDVEYYYAAADIYVGPSTEDALPLPPAEAMACGLPVIVTKQCGIAEIIHDGEDGFVIENSQAVDELVNKIRQLWGNPALRQRTGENAAVTAKNFTWERSSRDFIEVLRCALARKSNHEYEEKNSDSAHLYAKSEAGREE